MQSHRCMHACIRPWQKVGQTLLIFWVAFLDEVCCCCCKQRRSWTCRLRVAWGAGMAACQLAGPGTRASLTDCQVAHNVGMALRCFEGACTDLQQCEFLGNGDACSLSATGRGAAATVHKCTFTRELGIALSAQDGASVAISSARFVNCSTCIAIGEAATATISGTSFDGCTEAATVRRSGRVTMEECSVMASGTCGACVSDVGSHLTATNCTFSGSRGDQLICTHGAALQLQNSTMTEGNSNAVVVVGAGSVADLSGTTIGEHGECGVRAADGGAARVDNVAVTHCRIALFAQGTGTTLAAQKCTLSDCGAAARSAAAAVSSLSDCTIMGIRSEHALVASCGAQLAALGCTVSACLQGCIAVETGGGVTVADTSMHGGGATCATILLCDRGSCLTATNCSVKDSRGTGLAARSGAHGELKACVLNGSAGVGVHADGDSTSLCLNTCTIACSGLDAVLAEAAAVLTLRGCCIRGTAAGAGLMVGGGAEVAMTAGTVTDTHLSACCVTTGGYLVCDASTLAASVTGSGVTLGSGGRFKGTEVEVRSHGGHGIVQLGTSTAELVRCRCARANA
jgi:hypothetical protein